MSPVGDHSEAKQPLFYSLSCDHTFWLQSELDGTMSQLLEASRAERCARPGSLREAWDAFEVDLFRGYSRPVKEPKTKLSADIIPVNISWDAFSERACAELGSTLEHAGELLPIKSTAGTYYLFNPLRAVEGLLDLIKTEVDSDTTLPALPAPMLRIRGQLYFSCAPATEETLFVLAECRSRSGLLATESFRSAVERARLRGFAFRPKHAGVGYP